MGGPALTGADSEQHVAVGPLRHLHMMVLALDLQLHTAVAPLVGTGHVGQGDGDGIPRGAILHTRGPPGRVVASAGVQPFLAGIVRVRSEKPKWLQSVTGVLE